MNEIAIKINSLTKSYGKSRGIEKVDLTVEKGDFFGFIGPNGSGKSTTIRTLLNLLFPTEGTAEIFGLDIVKDSKKIKDITGYVPSEINYYGEQTVIKFLQYAASLKNTKNDEKIELLIKELDIPSEKKIEELSFGNRKKVAIVVALLGDPKLVILDEPANGLDPLIQNKLFEILINENKKGLTVFLSSHNLTEVEKYCKRVAVIKEGKIVDVNEISHFNNKIKKIHIKGKLNLEVIESLKPDKITDTIYDTKDSEHINSFNFLYSKDINLLIKSLAEHEIEDISITETALEDRFMSYYEKGETK